jgi:hypothetical protein
LSDSLPAFSSTTNSSTGSIREIARSPAGVAVVVGVVAVVADVAVAVPVDVTVVVDVLVVVAVGVGVRVGVPVAVGVVVVVSVGVGVGVGVVVGVAVGVRVGVRVAVGVRVRVGVATIGVGVDESVEIGVAVDIAAGVFASEVNSAVVRVGVDEVLLGTRGESVESPPLLSRGKDRPRVDTAIISTMIKIAIITSIELSCSITELIWFLVEWSSLNLLLIPNTVTTAVTVAKSTPNTTCDPIGDDNERVRMTSITI